MRLNASSLNLNTDLDTFNKSLENPPEFLQIDYKLLQRSIEHIDSALAPERYFDWKETQNAFQRIIHLADLPERWDGYAAPKFQRKQINRAVEIFQLLQDYSKKNSVDWKYLEPFIAPGSDGSILFEWAGQRFKLKNLEIYIPQDLNHSLEYLKTDIKLNTDVEGECKNSGVRELLDWLLKI